MVGHALVEVADGLSEGYMHFVGNSGADCYG